MGVIVIVIKDIARVQNCPALSLVIVLILLLVMMMIGLNFIVMIDGHGYQYFPLGMRDYHGDDEEGVDDTHVRGNTDQPCDKAKPNHGDNLGGQNCHFLSQRPFLFLLVACLRLEC